MIPRGFSDYVLSKDPAVTPECRTFGGSALTWDLFKAEIDSGHPMTFAVDSGTDGVVDHLVAAVGYRRSTAIRVRLLGHVDYCYPALAAVPRNRREHALGSLGWLDVPCGRWLTPPAPTPTPTPTPTPSPTADVTPPVTTINGADDKWHASAVSLSISATDDWSGIASTEYSLDGGLWISALL